MKNLFVVPVVVLSLFFSTTLFANSLAPSSQAIPYYGDNFYQAVHSGTRDESLKTTIKNVLRSFHVKRAGQTDQLVSSCDDTNKSCYSQVTIGYNSARKFLMGYFYLVKQDEGYGIREVYCDRIYDNNDFRGGKGPGPGLVPNSNVINVEHTWPQSRFSGRFNKETQKSDLHHLFPSDSQLNGIRGNYKFGEVTKEDKSLKCGNSHFGSGDNVSNIFEPPKSHKGLVARALFYFSLRYDMPITPEEEKALKKWHRENPVTQEEIKRNEEIFKTQKNRNPFIDHPELAEMISDF